MNLQRILSPMRRAISDYDMIQDGDNIAVGLSGGKDSLVLLSALAEFRRFSPAPFSLTAITVDMGFENSDFSRLKEFCDSRNVQYHIERTMIYDIIFKERKESNPCSLCANMRRGALASTATAHGCNKLALGHHADDVIETFLLSMFYEGRLSVFSPVSRLERSGVTVIRPMIYLKEKDISAMAKDYPVFHNPCPADHFTKREYMKKLIENICKEIPFAKDRMISAISHPERNNLWQKPDNN